MIYNLCVVRLFVCQIAVKCKTIFCAAVTPSDYSWFSFGLSVAIGGTAVFLCVGSVVIVKLLLFRSRQIKRETNKKHHEDSMGKNSSADLQAHGIQFDSKDLVSSDDKDPDIIPSNIGTDTVTLCTHLFILLWKTYFYWHDVQNCCSFIGFLHRIFTFYYNTIFGAIPAFLWHFSYSLYYFRTCSRSWNYKHL